MKLDFISKEEPDKIKRVIPKSKVMEEYEGDLKQLSEGQVGKIEVVPKDGVRLKTIRGWFNRAGKNINLNI